jgi:hypothetical protein
MLTDLKRCLSILAVMLVAGAQVFGLQRGYECHHHEVAMVTGAEHCHRAPAGFVPCANTPAEEDAGHHEHEEESERHEPLVVSTETGISVLAGVSIPHFVATLLAELPVFDRACVQECAESHMLKLPPAAESGRPPPAALQVARCVVLLV